MPIRNSQSLIWVYNFSKAIYVKDFGDQIAEGHLSVDWCDNSCALLPDQDCVQSNLFQKIFPFMDSFMSNYLRSFQCSRCVAVKFLQNTEKKKIFNWLLLNFSNVGILWLASIECITDLFSYLLPNCYNLRIYLFHLLTSLV